jgi:hypothetical protein
MAEGNRRVLQDDFSAGAFPFTSFEQIPVNGAYDVVNLLIADDRSLKIRGGSRWAAPALDAGNDLAWSWSGVIGSTRRTVVANGLRVGAVDDSTGTTSAVSVMGASFPPPGPGVSLAGFLFTPAGQAISPTLAVSAPALVRNSYAVAGNRLWAANLGSTRVDFSDVGAPGTFGATSFHQIPEGGLLGMIGLRDAVLLFTTAGVWTISNVGLNLTDTAGNVQHRIDRYSPSMVLWDANGLGASYEGSLVIPARDGVYLLSYGVASEAPQGFTLISRPIAALYRSYVAAGHRPGQPTVFNGHLFLPIISSSYVFVDLLVCRLDMPGLPWTRVASYNTGPKTLATSVFTGNLIAGGGAVSPRLMTLDYFTPSLSMTDADGVGWTTVLKTRAPVTPDDAATLARVRLGYQQTGGAPTSANYLNDLGGSTALSGFAGDNSSTERVPWSWRVAKPARYSTIEVAQAGAPSVFRVKSFEWFVREHGRV